jgi:Ca2+-binding EF-hand superfamily protein
VPRDARLHYRKGSPLGLTIEELDDRGLLDGGGSVPNYYTSIKQRGRRSMELRKRSSRIQERGQESLAKLLNGFFHVIRTLMKRGIEIEESCKSMDTEGRGMVDKKKFSLMLKDIGIPFVPREVAEIARRYTVPSSDLLDYESLLRDAGIKGINRNEAQSGNKDADSEVNPRVMLTVKNMLLESTKSLGKSVDDVYRIFARWDHDGTGTVTATQFMRVLARLHVELSEQDQDFLVEILDMNSSGRVDFESLLNFCFADSVPNNELGSPAASGKSFYGEDSAIHGDTISTEGKNSVEYSGSGSGSGIRRPHTASTERRSGSSSNARPESDSNLSESDHISREGKLHLAGISKRPLTASARVYGNAPIDKGIGIRRRLSMDERYLAGDVSDDGIDDDDELLTPRDIRKAEGKNMIGLEQQYINNGQGYPDGSLTGSLNGSYHGSINDAVDLQDGASFNDNTLITADQDELYFGSPQGLPVSDGFTAFSQRTHDSQQTGGHSRPWQGLQGIEPNQQRVQYSYYQRPDQYEADEVIALPMENGKVNVEYVNTPVEPYEHLAFLATQTLTTVRDFIIGRHRSGKNLREIYQHFDRQSKQYFDANDFMKATSDLRYSSFNKHYI